MFVLAPCLKRTVGSVEAVCARDHPTTSLQPRPASQTGDGRLMVRVGADRNAEAMARDGAEPMDFTGKKMKVPRKRGGGG